MVTMTTKVSDLIGRDIGNVIMVTMAMKVSDLIGRDVGDIIMVIG